MSYGALCGFAFVFSLLFCLLACLFMITLFKKVFAFQKVTVIVGEEKRRAFSVAGIATVLSVFLSVLFCLLFTEEKYSPNLYILLTAAVLFSAVGLVDDLRVLAQDRRFKINKALKETLKLMLIVAFAVGLFRTNPSGTVTFVLSENSFNLGWLYIPVTVLIAYAFTEGGRISNGISNLYPLTALPGCILFAFLCLSRQGHGNLGGAVICFALCGSIIGILFLSRNRFFADLGNCGTSFISFLTVGVAFLLGYPTVLFISCALWLCQSLCVILNYGVFYLSGKKKSLFKTTPLENHLLLCGVDKKTTVFIFATISVIFNLVAFIVTRGQ